MLKIDRLYRKDGYTSDGFFLILSELENARLQKKATTDSSLGQPELGKFVARLLDNPKVEMIQIGEIEKDGRKMLKFSSSEFNGCINPEYLKLFKGKNFEFYCTGVLAPLQVYKNGVFLGFIAQIMAE